MMPNISSNKRNRTTTILIDSSTILGLNNIIALEDEYVISASILGIMWGCAPNSTISISRKGVLIAVLDSSGSIDLADTPININKHDDLEFVLSGVGIAYVTIRKETTTDYVLLASPTSIVSGTNGAISQLYTNIINPTYSKLSGNTQLSVNSTSGEISLSSAATSNSEYLADIQASNGSITLSNSFNFKGVDLSSVSAGSQLLSDAIFLIDWSTSANSSGKYALNLNDSRTPSENIIAFPTGPIVNESGQTTPLRTNFYANVTDPSGITNNSTRLVSNAVNQVLYLHRSSLSGALPSNTYTLRFRARSTPGSGSWTINYGSSASYASGTVQDLDWANTSNDSATTFTREMTNPVNDIAIRLPTTGSDIIIDRIQLYSGNSSSIPSWSSEVITGGRRAFSLANSLPSGANSVDTTGLNSGMLIFDPIFPQKRSITEYTILTVNSIDSANTSSQHIINYHPGEGGNTTNTCIIVDGTSPYIGEINIFTGHSSRSAHAFNISGDGIFIAGNGRNSTTNFVWNDSIPVLKESSSFTGLSVSRWTVGGFNTSNVSDLRSLLAPGDYYYTILWDRLLSPLEFSNVVKELRIRLNQKNVSLSTITDFHVISGDSNAQRSTGDWSQLVTADNYFSPGRNMFMMNTSVGGEGINDIESTRFNNTDAPGLLYACDNDRYALYHLCIGTNDWDIIDGYSGTNSEKSSQYCIRVQSLISQALAIHDRVHVLWYSLLPQNTDSVGRGNWEIQRLLVNSEMSSWIESQTRVHLCDVGGSATIGSRALQDGGGGNLLFK